MDLLFKRYASPFSLLDQMIQLNRLSEFVTSLINTTEEEKLWQMYLGMLSNPMYENDVTFNEFKEKALKSSSKEKPKKMTDKEIEATIKHSRELFNSFKP